MSYITNEVSFLEGAYAKSMWIKWPRRCRITGKWVWLKKAICAVRMYIGPGDPVFEYRYYDEKEFIILRLKTGF
jgi:hypothetical protein